MIYILSIHGIVHQGYNIFHLTERTKERWNPSRHKMKASTTEGEQKEDRRHREQMGMTKKKKKKLTLSAEIPRRPAAWTRGHCGRWPFQISLSPLAAAVAAEEPEEGEARDKDGGRGNGGRCPSVSVVAIAVFAFS